MTPRSAPGGLRLMPAATVRKIVGENPGKFYGLIT
jgi:hypothetical protein